MIFELGKRYIVDVTEKGIIPLMEFNDDQWYNKDFDDLDFLTDEEKTVVVNDVLDYIRAEIMQYNRNPANYPVDMISIETVLQIINKYRTGANGNK